MQTATLEVDDVTAATHLVTVTLELTQDEVDALRRRATADRVSVSYVVEALVGDAVNARQV